MTLCADDKDQHVAATELQATGTTDAEVLRESVGDPDRFGELPSSAPPPGDRGFSGVLRSALFGALAKVPDVTIENDGADAAGRRGLP